MVTEAEVLVVANSRFWPDGLKNLPPLPKNGTQEEQEVFRNEETQRILSQIRNELDPSEFIETVEIIKLKARISVVEGDVRRILRDVAAGRANPSQGDFIVNRLEFLKEKLANLIQQQEAELTLPIEEPILRKPVIEIITPEPGIEMVSAEEQKIFGLTVKQLAVLVGLGVLVL